jgi:hypothetical protein
MLPRLLRNRLAEVILDALHDPEARRGLQTLAAVGADSKAPARIVDLPQRALPNCFEERDGGLQLKNGWHECAVELRERAGRASRAIDNRPLDARDPPLPVALAAAATLFDAGLYFEVHELLEPYWGRASGSDREALQGLIQVAVGFEHLANGNAGGARALLEEGCVRMQGRQLERIDLGSFAREVRACLEGISASTADTPPTFDWPRVPRVPSRS